jgi:hypothetical protein
VRRSRIGCANTGTQADSSQSDPKPARLYQLGRDGLLASPHRLSSVVPGLGMESSKHLRKPGYVHAR